MEQELRTLMRSTSVITAQVGQRIEWGTHPQGTPLPAIVLTVASGFEGVHMNGTGPHEGRIQIDCYGMTYGAAKNAASAVVAALNAYRGGGFLFISHASTRDSREGGTNEAERPYRTGLDFNITWRPI